MPNLTCTLRLAYLLALLVLPGCASMSADECRTADWRMIGFEDGSNGRLLNNIGNHRKACAKAGVTPDMAAYEAGHKKGVEVYCTIENGFKLGVGGGQYNGVCAVAKEDSFLTGFKEGKLRFDTQKALKDLKAKIDIAHDDLANIATDVEEHEKALLADATPSDERKEHLRAIKALQRKKKDVRDALRLMEAEYVDRQTELQELIEYQKSRGYD